MFFNVHFLNTVFSPKKEKVNAPKTPKEIQTEIAIMKKYCELWDDLTDKVNLGRLNEDQIHQELDYLQKEQKRLPALKDFFDFDEELQDFNKETGLNIESVKQKATEPVRTVPLDVYA